MSSIMPTTVKHFTFNGTSSAVDHQQRQVWDEMDTRSAGASAQGGTTIQVTLRSQARTEGDFISKPKGLDIAWTELELKLNRSTMKKLYRHEHPELKKKRRKSTGQSLTAKMAGGKRKHQDLSEESADTVTEADATSPSSESSTQAQLSKKKRTKSEAYASMIVDVKVQVDDSDVDPASGSSSVSLTGSSSESDDDHDEWNKTRSEKQKHRSLLERVQERTFQRGSGENLSYGWDLDAMIALANDYEHGTNGAPLNPAASLQWKSRVRYYQDAENVAVDVNQEIARIVEACPTYKALQAECRRLESGVQPGDEERYSRRTWAKNEWDSDAPSLRRITLVEKLSRKINSLYPEEAWEERKAKEALFNAVQIRRWKAGELDALAMNQLAWDCVNGNNMQQDLQLARRLWQQCLKLQAAAGIPLHEDSAPVVGLRRLDTGYFCKTK